MDSHSQPDETPHDHYSPTYPQGDRSYVPYIHRLPPEVVLEVVRFVVKTKIPLRDLSRLAQVCKQWRELIYHTTSLWSSISAAEGQALVSRASEMAKDVPLDLEYLDDTALVPPDTFFGLFFERIAQWRSFTVQFTSEAYKYAWQTILGYLKNETLPNLEALHLHGPGTIEQTIPGVALSGGHAAAVKLKEITLLRVKIDDATLHLTGLTSLTLSFGLGALGFFTPEIHTNVDRFPSNISLTRLKSLNLSAIPSSIINDILSSIEAPQLQTLTIYFDCVNQPPSDLLPATLRRHAQALGAMTSHIQNITVKLYWYNSWEVRVGGLSITLLRGRASVNINGYQESFDWISSALGQYLRDTPLSLEVKLGFSNASDLEWFSHQTNVTKLTLVYNPSIVPFLGRPTESPPVTWLLPRVETLLLRVLEREDSKNQILKMLEVRYCSRDHAELMPPRGFVKSDSRLPG